MPSDRPISIMGHVFSSIKEAARDLGVDPRPLKVRLDSTAPEWEDWVYLEKIQSPFTKSQGFPCTYLHTHLPTGSFYVGSTKDATMRKSVHMWKLKNNTSAHRKMQELWNSDPNESNWLWTFFLYPDRQACAAAEQDYLSKNKDNPLLLNSYTDIRSTVETVMNREALKDKIRTEVQEKVKTLTPEQKIAWGERSRQTALKRWSDPEKRAAFLGPNNPSAKGVIINGVVYGSLNEASIKTGHSLKTIWTRLRSDKHPNFSYVGK